MHASLQYLNNTFRLPCKTYQWIERNYLNTQPVFNELIRFAKSKKLKIDPKQLKRSRPLIDNELKAYIARNIIDNKGFYPILGREDNVLQVAIKEMKKKFPF